MEIQVFESEEKWLQAREGMFTASQIGRLLTSPGEGLSKGAITYCKEVFNETIAEDVISPYISVDMQHGKDNECVAIRELGKLFPFDEIEHFGGNQFLFCKFNDYSGASPDAVCYKKFGVEVKCPTSKMIHIDRLFQLKKPADLLKMDAAIYAQIQFNMMCFEMDKWLFASFYEGMKDPALCLFYMEIPSDKPFQKVIEDKLKLAKVQYDVYASEYAVLAANGLKQT